MHEGAMVKTGGCNMKHVNVKAEGTVNPADGQNEFVGQCKKNEAVWVRKREVFDASTPTKKKPSVYDRINNFNTLGDHNMTGLGAPDAPAAAAESAMFIQKLMSSTTNTNKKKQSSNEELPMYQNTTLNGKGWSMNAAPQQRYDSRADKEIFSGQYVEKGEAEAAEEEVKEEESALGAGTKPILKSDDKFTVVAMEIPEWMCTTICAGLNLKEIMDGKEINEPATAPKPVPVEED